MTLKQFVLETINKIHDFDAKNRKSIKKLIRLAIEELQFRTVAKVEDSRGIEVLYLASGVEEKFLAQITEFAMGSEEETSIDSVYDGYVVRNY